MKLYFQAGKKRLAINTEKRTWNNNYYYLGPWHTYIKTDAAGLRDIARELDFNSYDYDNNF